MGDEKVGQLDKALGALGTLERATEFQTFLLLASMALALNISLSLVHHTSLTGASWEFAKTSVPVGQVLVFLTGFALFMSCIVGVLKYIAEQIVFHPVVWVAVLLRVHGSSDSYRYRRPAHHVRPYELLREASKDGGNEFLELYNDYDEQKRKSEVAETRTATLSFAVLVLVLIELALPSDSALSANVIQFLNGKFVHLGDTTATVVVIVLLLSWLQRFIADDLAHSWVLCPKLCKKLEADRERELV